MDLNKKFEQIGVSIAERIKNTTAYLDKLRESLRIEVLERRADTERLTNKTDKLDSELAQERAIRSAADDSHDKELKDLRTSFDNEVKERLAKDSDHDDRLLKLRNDLTDETRNRKNEDVVINKRIDDTNTKLDKEIVDRKAKNVEHEKALETLDTNLKKEIQDRTNDVKALNGRADNIEKNLATEVRERKEAIQAEVKRAEGAYPKKNGAGAFGVWNVDISGRAAVATEADHAKRASEADHATKATNDNNGRNIVTTYAIQGSRIVGPNTNWDTLTDICQYKIQNCTMTAACNAPVGEYQFGILVVDGIRDALDGEHRINQTYYPHNPSISPIWVRMRNSTGWTPWKSMSTKQYVVDYAPSKAGSGANGTWNISINGNAKTATDAVRGSYPTGFNSKTANATWGKGNQIGSFVTGWDGPGGSDIAFRNNGGQLNVVIDGQYYANEGNSLVLHEGNWNNYAPSKTGGGASGTWGINVTGSSNSATYVTASDRIDYGANRLQYFNLHSTNRGTANTNGSPINDWVHVIRMNHGNGNGYFVDLAAGLNTNGLWYRRITAGAMSGWHTVLDTTNWNNYAPSKTGGGASGTWGISITGNADSVDGYHENSFLRYRDATGTNGVGSLWSQIGIRQYNNAHPDGVGNTYSYGATVSLPGASSRLDVWYNHRSSDNGDGLWYRTGWDNDKRPWAKILDSTNYNQYAPTKTGGGASGSWNISVTGSSASCTGNARTATNVAWDGVTGKPAILIDGGTHGTLYLNNWFRSRGNTGWYNENYGGGWYMQDTTWIRAYNNKGVYTAGKMQADSGFYGKLYGDCTGTAGAVAWNNVTEKPATYTPSPHNHDSAYPSTTGARASGTWSINVTGNSGSANVAKLIGKDGGTGGGMNFHWNGQGGQPTWLWGGNDGTNMYVYNPSNFSVNYAKSAGAVAWGNVSSKPAQATRWPNWNEVTDKPSLLATAGGTMSGNINWTARGTNYIGNGANDAANGCGGALNNLVISSWNGVSFTTSCGGQTYTNKNAVSINCRNGHVYANTYHGYLNGGADSATKATNDGSNRNIVNTYATKTELANAIKALSDRVAALERWIKNGPKGELFDANGRLCFPNGNKFWID